MVSAPTAPRRGTAPAPVRMVHLGLGSFFRAHQAWYTDQAGDGGAWGIAAFTGGDEFALVRSVSRAHAAADHEAWLGYLISPDVRVLTTTVTEAGYLRNAAGGLDMEHPQVVADVTALRSDHGVPVRSVPARLLAGLLARRRQDAGPMTLVPCDNLPHNGPALAQVLRDIAHAVDPTLLSWMDEQVSIVTTMVDRITPEPTADDRRTVLAATGLNDCCPVVTEPFAEWCCRETSPAAGPRGRTLAPS